MIKGRLGLRWRGAALITVGLAGPIGYLVASGGPGAQKTERVAARPGEVDPAGPAGSTAPGAPGAPAGAARSPAPPARNTDGITPLPPDDDPPPSR
jgi:hypothetical protein